MSRESQSRTLNLRPLLDRGLYKATTTLPAYFLLRKYRLIFEDASPFFLSCGECIHGLFMLTDYQTRDMEFSSPETSRAALLLL